MRRLRTASPAARAVVAVTLILCFSLAASRLAPSKPNHAAPIRRWSIDQSKEDALAAANVDLIMRRAMLDAYSSSDSDSDDEALFDPREILSAAAVDFSMRRALLRADSGESDDVRDVLAAMAMDISTRRSLLDAQGDRAKLQADVREALAAAAVDLSMRRALLADGRPQTTDLRDTLAAAAVDVAVRRTLLGAGRRDDALKELLQAASVDVVLRRTLLDDGGDDALRTRLAAELVDLTGIRRQLLARISEDADLRATLKAAAADPGVLRKLLVESAAAIDDKAAEDLVRRVLDRGDAHLRRLSMTRRSKHIHGAEEGDWTTSYQKAVAMDAEILSREVAGVRRRGLLSSLAGVIGFRTFSEDAEDFEHGNADDYPYAYPFRRLLGHRKRHRSPQANDELWEQVAKSIIGERRLQGVPMAEYDPRKWDELARLIAQERRLQSDDRHGVASRPRRAGPSGFAVHRGASNEDTSAMRERLGEMLNTPWW